MSSDTFKYEFSQTDILNPEHQYLDILRELRGKLIAKGATSNRTAVKAVKVVGRTMRFDLSQGRIPMLTTKKLHLKSIVHELIWFLRGETNLSYLKEHGVRIWDEWALPGDIMRNSPDDDRRHYVNALAEAADLRPSEAAAQIDKAEAEDVLLDLIEQYGITLAPVSYLHRAGDLGPLYGEQWRRFPAGDYFKSKQMPLEELNQYINAMAPDQRAILAKEAHGSVNGRDGIDLSLARDVLTDIGIDQISQSVHLLKTQPNSRRNLITAWNPQVVPSDALSPQENVMRGRAALAACHTLVNFVTEELSGEERIALVEKARGYPCELQLRELLLCDEDFAQGYFTAKGIASHRLNCLMHQRSADFMLGVPYNIASYAIFTRMMAQVTGMVAGEFIWNGADVHLYKNHLVAADTQLSRTPGAFPTLLLNPDIDSIFDFKMADFKLIGYEAQDAIKADVAV